MQQQLVQCQQAMAAMQHQIATLNAASLKKQRQQKQAMRRSVSPPASTTHRTHRSSGRRASSRSARFNRAPEFVTPEFKRKLQEKLKVVVELTPREHHEAVGRSERNHDLLTRAAEPETMLQRAGLDVQWCSSSRACTLSGC